MTTVNTLFKMCLAYSVPWRMLAGPTRRAVLEKSQSEARDRAHLVLRCCVWPLALQYVSKASDIFRRSLPVFDQERSRCVRAVLAKEQGSRRHMATAGFGRAPRPAVARALVGRRRTRARGLGDLTAAAAARVR